jgi:hypothetical protein
MQPSVICRRMQPRLMAPYLACNEQRFPRPITDACEFHYRARLLSPKGHNIWTEPRLSLTEA